MLLSISLLHRVRELITALRPVEVEVLEKMLTNEESVHSSNSTEQSAIERTMIVNKDEKQQPSLRARAGIKHKRRHSDPTSRRSFNFELTKRQASNESACESMKVSALRQSVSTLSLVPAIIDPSINGSGAKNSSQTECSADPRRSVQCRSVSSSNHRRMSAQASLGASTATSTSCHSIETSCSTSSTMDSFELALAVAAKSSPFISPGTRQLLHRLFITIAG